MISQLCFRGGQVASICPPASIDIIQIQVDLDPDKSVCDSPQRAVWDLCFLDSHLFKSYSPRVIWGWGKSDRKA